MGRRGNGAAHGSVVNGKQVKESLLLPGDVLGIGSLSFFLRSILDSTATFTSADDALAWETARQSGEADLVHATT